MDRVSDRTPTGGVGGVFRGVGRLRERVCVCVPVSETCLVFYFCYSIKTKGLSSAPWSHIPRLPPPPVLKGVVEGLGPREVGGSGNGTDRGSVAINQRKKIVISRYSINHGIELRSPLPPGPPLDPEWTGREGGWGKGYKPKCRHQFRTLNQ